MPKTDKEDFSDFVMGSLRRLIFPVTITASTGSGGLKRSHTLKTATAGKHKIIIV